MRAFLLFILSLHFCVSTLAQQTDKAKKLLDKVQEKIRSTENISIKFTHTLENIQQGVRQQTQGDIIIQGDKYRLNYMGATILFDKKNKYTIIPENEEVTIESTENTTDNLSINPSQIFSFYNKGYNYKWDIEQTVKGQKIQYIELIPIKTNSQIKKILLGIDLNTLYIYKLIEIGKNQTQTTIVVNELKTNENLPSDLFVFDKEKYTKMGYYISNY